MVIFQKCFGKLVDFHALSIFAVLRSYLVDEITQFKTKRPHIYIQVRGFTNICVRLYMIGS